MAWNRYPDRQATELRAALADLHGVGPDQVFCANGSNEVLQCLCLAYGGPGRSVAVFEPTYALHSHIAHLTGTAVVEGQRRPDFSLDLDVVRDVMAAERPAITFLCSPNNPTGLAEDPSTVRAVLGAAPGLVVVDEAYGQFADWSALDSSTTAYRSSSPGPSPRPGRWPPPASATWSGRPRSWPSWSGWPCRTTSTPSSRPPASWLSAS
jgi:histidinol-phosphate aminotransferase